MMEQAKASWILIPFHHRHDLLRPLVNHLAQFCILIVDDGPKATDWSELKTVYSNLEVIRASGNSGFTKAVNIGLAHLESQNVSKALVLNDDAWVDPASVTELLQYVSATCLVSPKIVSSQSELFGITISSIGRVKLQQTLDLKPDALLGTCLGMPTSWRFDSRFIHGFEDVELSIRFQKAGGELKVVPHLQCTHIHGASLNPVSPKGLRYSVYGHLLVFDSFLKSPLIILTYLALIAFEKDSQHRKTHLFCGIYQGVSDWFCSAIAARMASSSAGSSKARYNTTSR